jgi:hypothetical protein
MQIRNAGSHKGRRWSSRISFPLAQRASRRRRGGSAPSASPGLASRGRGHAGRAINAFGTRRSPPARLRVIGAMTMRLVVANGIVLTISGWLSAVIGRKRYFLIYRGQPVATHRFSTALRRRPAAGPAIDHFRHISAREAHVGMEVIIVRPKIVDGFPGLGDGVELEGMNGFRSPSGLALAETAALVHGRGFTAVEPGFDDGALKTLPNHAG